MPLKMFNILPFRQGNFFFFFGPVHQICALMTKESPNSLAVLGIFYHSVSIDPAKHHGILDILIS